MQGHFLHPLAARSMAYLGTEWGMAWRPGYSCQLVFPIGRGDFWPGMDATMPEVPEAGYSSTGRTSQELIVPSPLK